MKEAVLILRWPLAVRRDPGPGMISVPGWPKHPAKIDYHKKFLLITHGQGGGGNAPFLKVKNKSPPL